MSCLQGLQLVILLSAMVTSTMMMKLSASFALPRRLASPRSFLAMRMSSASAEVSVMSAVQAEVLAAMEKAFGPQACGSDAMVTAAQAKHGDYQSTVAMSLTGKLGSPPRTIAQKLVDQLSLGPVIGKADITGPGFVNFHLSPEFVKNRMARKLIDREGRVGMPRVAQPKKIIVDFSSPNIAKEMHVGHLRSTILGDTLSRVLSFLGHDVLRLNHVGDWGTSFGMLLHFLHTARPQLVSALLSIHASEQPLPAQLAQAVRQVDLGDLSDLYRQAKQAYDHDEDFKHQARQQVVRLQQDDPSSVFLWQVLCEKSREEFAQLYDLLGVRLIERGESFYRTHIPDTLHRLAEHRLLTESDGAQCVFLPPSPVFPTPPPPVIVRKQDGGYLYATTDLAAVYHRVHVEQADCVLYVTDSGQAAHFAAIFEVARLAGWDRRADGSCAQLVHVPFGVVLGADNKRMKTRAGETVKLKDLLHEAIRRAHAALEARMTQPDPDTAPAGLDTLPEVCANKSRTLGLAAVKYADLSLHRETNYRFHWDRMLALTGNTAPYMLYAHVRIRGIQRRLAREMLGLQHEVEDSQLDQMFKDHLSPHMDRFEAGSPEERQLVRQLLRWEDVLLEVSVRHYPHKLCDFLYELAQLFNAFYERCPVLQAPDQQVQCSRAALCAVTADTLAASLALLGIDTVHSL